MSAQTETTTTQERSRLSVQLELALERPMIVLSIIWVILIIWDIAGNLPRGGSIAIDIIWVIFIAELLLRFAIATNKRRFLRRNWISVIALFIPAFRVGRIGRVFRILRFGRGLRLAKFLASMNRGMRTLRRTLRQRAIAFVLSLTTVLVFGGAAAMWAFERGVPQQVDFKTYGSTLWWTAMLMTTMGSASWPRTTEGRILCLILAVYAFAMFGYITGAIASFFIGRDRETAAKAAHRSQGDA